MTKEQLRTQMGEVVRKEREARDMSIDELANLMGITPGFLGLIERGKRGIRAYFIWKLTDIFNISADCFFMNPDNNASSEMDFDKSEVHTKRSKLNSLTTNLNEKELDFLIAMIKYLPKLK